jgi:hypothetical protein
MENMPAGWLSDHRDEWVERYWDGQKWTGQTRVTPFAKPEAQRAKAAPHAPAPAVRRAPREKSLFRGFIPVFVGTAVILLGTSLGLAYLDGRDNVPSETSAVAAPGSACVSAFEAAAAVPLDDVNDIEFDRTVRDCVGVDEWASGLKRYPDALGQYTVTDSDVPSAIRTVCFDNESTPVCLDAAAQGMLP